MRKKTRGGKRSGAGRPPKDPQGNPRRSRSFNVTDDEYAWLRNQLEYHRVNQLKPNESFTDDW